MARRSLPEDPLFASRFGGCVSFPVVVIWSGRGYCIVPRYTLRTNHLHAKSKFQ
jgi:hypothetical protein